MSLAELPIVPVAESGASTTGAARRRVFAGAFLLLGCCSVAALPAAADGIAAALATATRLRDEARAGTAAYDRVRRLTVEVGPRLAGSEGDRRAVDWAVRELAAAGLANVRREPVVVPHWERGTAEARILSPWAQPLVVTAIGGSRGTPEEGVEAEVVRFASYAELDAADPATVAGKIAFIDRRTERARDGAGYGAAADGRSRGPGRALALGARALLIRSIGTSEDRIAHTGGMWSRPETAAIAAAALSNPDADLLAAQLASGQPVRVWLRLTARDLGSAMSANVVGEVVGREHPDEIVVLGAHLDSWDLGTGAVDDGAGVAIAIETARRIAALPVAPRRTVRVVLFANEEFGLSGALTYARDHAATLDRHVAAVEADFGGGAVFQWQSRVASADRGLLAPLVDLLAPLGAADAGNEARGGADLNPLYCAGRPVYNLTQDGTAYFDVHHTVNDTLDRVNAADLDQNVAAHVAWAWFLADTPVLPAAAGPPTEERAAQRCAALAEAVRTLPPASGGAG